MGFLISVKTYGSAKNMILISLFTQKNTLKSTKLSDFNYVWSCSQSFAKKACVNSRFPAHPKVKSFATDVTEKWLCSNLFGTTSRTRDIHTCSAIKNSITTFGLIVTGSKR